MKKAEPGQAVGPWPLNLPTYEASDLVPCPDGCRERIPHHHFAPKGDWVCCCYKDVPSERCICEDGP